MSYTPEERAAADAAVARLRAERDTPAEDAVGFSIERTEDRDELAAEAHLDELVEREEADAAEDFLAFWSTRSGKGKRLRNVIPGVDVVLPPELPLAFEVRSRALANDRTIGAVHELFGMLYGEGTLAKLIAGGLTGKQLSVLIMWGSTNGNGKDMDLAEATAEFERLQALQAAGKALRPSGSGPTSSGTGRSSKPTSRGSTSKKGRKQR